MTEKTCFVLGSSGETGKVLLPLLTQKFDKIILLNRRNIYKDLSPKIEERIVNFSHLKKENFQGCFQSSVFCCIGSTLSKVSKEEFQFIEKDLIVECGKFFKNLGCPHFHLVSSSTFLSRFWAGSGLFLSWF